MDRLVRHDSADAFADLQALFRAVGKSQLDETVCQAEETEADLTPFPYGFPLLFQRMQRQPLVENVVQGLDCSTYRMTEASEIKITIFYKCCQVDRT